MTKTSLYALLVAPWGANPYASRVAPPLHDIDGLKVTVERVGGEAMRDDDGGLDVEPPEHACHGRLALDVHVLHHLVKDEEIAREAEPSPRKVCKG